MLAASFFFEIFVSKWLDSQQSWRVLAQRIRVSTNWHSSMWVVDLESINLHYIKLIFFIKSRCKSMRRCVLFQNLGLWHLVPFHATSHRFLVFRSATASRDSQQSKHVKRMFQGIWDYSYNTFGLKNQPRMCKSKNRDATETYWNLGFRPVEKGFERLRYNPGRPDHSTNATQARGVQVLDGIRNVGAGLK